MPNNALKLAFQVENVMTALRGRGGSLVDIGSGDGRIVLGGGDLEGGSTF